MNSSRNRSGATAVLAALGAAYPFLVYAGTGRIPHAAWVLLALSLAIGRLLLLRRQTLARHLLPPLIFVIAAMAALGVMDAPLAVRLYPVLMGLAFAAAFGLSLLRGPTLIEIFAALTEPEPDAAALSYMRRLTWVWSVFLLINSTIAAATLFAPAWMWTLYNGLISYLLIGALFLGERLVRRRVKRPAC
jgi:uncharacterized membrane protein